MTIVRQVSIMGIGENASKSRIVHRTKPPTADGKEGRKAGVTEGYNKILTIKEKHLR